MRADLTGSPGTFGRTLNQIGRMLFWGSYFKFGFREDAFRAGVEVCPALTREPIWK